MSENFLSVLQKKTVSEKKEELVTSLFTNSSHLIASEREKRLGEQITTLSGTEKKRIGAAQRSLFLSNRLSSLYTGLISRLHELKDAIKTKGILGQEDFYDFLEYNIETYMNKIIFRSPESEKDGFLSGIIFCGNSDILNDSSNISDSFLSSEMQSAWKISNFDNDLCTVLKSSKKYSDDDINLFSYQSFVSSKRDDKKVKLLEMIEFYKKVLEERLGTVYTELSEVMGIMSSLEVQRELTQHFIDSNRVDSAEVIEAFTICSSINSSNSESI